MELPGPCQRSEHGCVDTDLLRAAYEYARDGYSSDRVVADPVLNRRFLDKCNELGLHHVDTVLNQALLNARKAKKLAGLPKSRRTSFGASQDEWEFASEIAIRFLERRENASSDRIICNPQRAAEFEAIAASLAPGFSSLQYRWAVLSLRKRKDLKPEIGARLLPAATVEMHAVDTLVLTMVPRSQGLYLFHAPGVISPLYIGEASNLQRRIAKHLDHSDNRDLAHWLWGHGSEQLQLELHVLERDTPARARKALELELIQSRNPLFNIKGR